MLPATFIERLERLLPPANLAAYHEAFVSPSPTAFRANRLKTTPLELKAELQSQDFTPAPLVGLPDAFSVPHLQRRALTESDAHHQGRLYIQNSSSMVPALLLDPGPDDWVLDLTAAPGSKTTQLAAMMGNQGRISAVERSRSRFFRMRDNLATQGVTNTRTYLRDGTGVGRQLPERFDRVLLDAPCSAEGRFTAAEPDPWQRWQTKKLRRHQHQQQRLLYSAVNALKPGGVLVYSTCTFSPEENELVLDAALRRFTGHLQVEAIDLPWDNTSAGIDHWEGRDLDPQVKHSLRLLPDGLAEGFFVARLRKTLSTEAQE